jgi:hypothetical protein
MAGLALVGVAYALDSRRDLLRRAARPEERERWREQLGTRLNEWQRQYGPTLRRAAVAAGLVPGVRMRWRVLAALAPQVADALQRMTGEAASRRAAHEVREEHVAEAPPRMPATGDPAATS